MAITLAVKAEPDDRSFDRVADRAEKRFNRAGEDAGKAFAKGLDEAASKADPKSADRWVRAYDKVADATGKVRVEEAKLADLRARGASDTRIIAQAEALERARRAEVRATRDAANAYQDLGSKANGLLGSLSNLASGTRFGGMIADTEALAARFGGVGLAVGGTITAVAGLAVGIGAATAKLYELGAMWDDIADGITGRTGMIGDDLQAVMDQVSAVALDSSSSIAQIGDIAGRVSASIGATGDQLGELTSYIADLNELTGEQTNIRQLGMLFDVFRVSGDKQVDTLNQLYTAFTKTQIPVNELIGLLVNAGPKVQQFGLDLGQTSSLLAQFADAGVEPEKMITGLNTALAKFAKSGQDPAKGLSDIIVKMRELHDAGKDVEATALAVETFGAKNASSFLQAVESGKLGARELSAAQQGLTKDIRETKGATDDFAQEWQRFKNFLQVDLQPVATSVFSGINQQLEWFTKTMHDSIGGIKSAWDTIKSAITGTPVPTVKIPTSPGLPAIVAPPTGGAAVAPPPGAGTASMGPLASMFGIPPKAGGGIAGRTASGRLWGPGTGTSDSILGIDPFSGMPTAWVSAGEGIVKASAMSRPGVAQIVSGLNGYAGGTGSGITSEVEWVAAIARQFGLELTSGRRNEPGSYHNIGEAGDFSNTYRMGPSTPQMQAFANYMSANFGGLLSELIHESPNFAHNIKDGRDVGPMGPGQVFNEAQAGYHGDHVHIALKPGALNALNALGTSDALKPQKGGLPVWIVGAESTPGGSGASGGSRMASSAGMPGMSGQQIGAPIAADFGLSQGLPGLAENLTNFLGNLAFAPALGALSGIGAGLDPTGRAQTGGGLFGMLGALASPNVETGAGGYSPGAMGGSSLAMYGGTAPTVSPGLGMAGAAAPSTVGAMGMPPTGFGGGGAPVGIGGLFGSPLGTPPGPAAGPGAGGMGGSAPNLPGMAGAAPTPTSMGGISPGAGPGGGGFGGAGSTGVGGMAMQAIQSGISMAGMALDTQLPGAGTAAAMAANIGVQLGNRAIGQAGKAAGLLAGGVMETLLPANSKLGDPNANWFGKIAAGFAGARPAIPNMTGQAAEKPSNGTPPDPLNDPAAKNAFDNAGSATDASKGGITVNYQNIGVSEDRAGADLVNHLTAMNSVPMAAGVL